MLVEVGWEEEGADQNKTSQSRWEGRWHTNERHLRTGNMQSPTKTLGEGRVYLGALISVCFVHGCVPSTYQGWD